MKTYTIIGGLNGSGKSSLTGVLLSKMNDFGKVIDVDKITHAKGDNKLAGGKEAIRQIDECLAHGLSFTQETTLSGARTLKTIKSAAASNYYIRLYYVGVNELSENLKRIANRVEKGGHNIPSDDVIRRYKDKDNALAVILPYCNEATFFDNENGFCEVAQYRNGSLIIETENPPKWLTDFRSYYSCFSYSTDEPENSDEPEL